MQSKAQKQQNALNYLLNKGTKAPSDNTEIEILKQRLAGVKKSRKVATISKAVEDNWYIEVYSVSYSKLRSSEAKRLRKKGKSTKAVKKQRRTISLVKTVKARPGLIAAYKFGMTEFSPKNHIFKLIQK